MSRLIAIILAATVALTTATANPAVALDQGDRQRLLLGLTALAIIGALANRDNDRDDDRYHRPDVTRPAPPPPYTGHGYVRPPQPRWSPSLRLLPISCQFQVQTRYGSRAVLGRDCMESNQVQTYRLPQRCAMTIDTSRGSRTVYGSRCLAEAGYRIEARRW
jgi:hypothetical protein